MGGPTLFETPAALDAVDPRAPLAARMRPRNLDEFAGQEHLIGEGRPLRRAIERDAMPSAIFWGPPGVGKTTLARIVARATQAVFVQLSAVSSGVADLRSAMSDAQVRGRDGGPRTILFIDEIHRFNKAQQDAVLPYVEDGTITLIGATTENPSFEVIAPLLSRSRVFTLEPLAPEALASLLRRALSDEERGLARFSVGVEEEALRALVDLSGGDARSALNTLELAVKDVASEGRLEAREVAVADVESIVERRLRHDKSGDAHYDTISAFIKSLRGSDPDAAVYWLARLLEAGEDPLFIVRRMVILAAEDVGLADPQALAVAVSAQQAVHFVGMPEGYLILAEAALYLALAPKSNSAMTAYQAAMADVQAQGQLPVPLHLRNAVTGLMKSLGYGAGYENAHDHEGNVAAEQVHLPEALTGHRYYRAGTKGEEASPSSSLRSGEQEGRHRAPDAPQLRASEGRERPAPRERQRPAPPERQRPAPPERPGATERDVRRD
ncbi:MAG: putative ATPase [Chloroflexi bacterium]|nr:MAG: putative ATPase [Chloroflexota bacterium]